MATVRRPAANEIQSVRSGLATLGPRAAGAKLAIRELGGSSPITITLQGGFGVEQGAEWPSSTKGETRTPLGSSEGYGSLTALSFGKTEMQLSLDAAFLRRRDITVENARTPFTPEDVAELFMQLQLRGRECLVTLGSFVRRGLLREAVAVPGRGHTLDFDGGINTLALNLVLRLTWEWAGRGEPPTASIPDSPADIAGALGAADASYGLALASTQDLFAPDAFTAVSDAIGQVRAGLGGLRSTVRQMGSILNAPARLVNQALDAARSLGNTLNDCENLIGDTRDAYLALGPAAESVATALGPRSSQLARVANAKGDVRAANQAAMAAVVALFDAVAQRKARRVGVTPGQSLAEVARRELGAADRWPEIADRNGIAGQVVPPGVTEVELPVGG